MSILRITPTRPFVLATASFLGVVTIVASLSAQQKTVLVVEADAGHPRDEQRILDDLAKNLADEARQIPLTEVTREKAAADAILRVLGHTAHAKSGTFQLELVIGNDKKPMVATCMFNTNCARQIVVDELSALPIQGAMNAFFACAMEHADIHAPGPGTATEVGEAVLGDCSNQYLRYRQQARAFFVASVPEREALDAFSRADEHSRETRDEVRQKVISQVLTARAGNRP